MSNLLKFEIVKHSPYRFIGKSVYARAQPGAWLQCGDAWFHDFLQENTAWVFTKLDEMKAYASDITIKANLLTWEKYCDKSELLGFTTGRFMKADCPIPNGFDYFDIAEGYMAKGVFDHWEDGTHDTKIREAIEKHGGYKSCEWRFMGELDYGDNKQYGYFISCDKE